MTGRIYFSFLFCLLTNPLMNALWVDFYGLKFSWMFVLNFIFVVSCTVFLTGIDKIETQLKKAKIWNDNRVKEIIRLEGEIDEIKKEIEELKINN